MTTQEIPGSRPRGRRAERRACGGETAALLAMAEALCSQSTRRPFWPPTSRTWPPPRAHQRCNAGPSALTPAASGAMAKGIREVAALPDPVGARCAIVRPNGLVIEKTWCPWA